MDDMGLTPSAVGVLGNSVVRRLRIKISHQIVDHRHYKLASANSSGIGRSLTILRLLR